MLCYLDGLFVGVEAVGGSGVGDPAVDAVGVAGDADDASAGVQGRERGGNRSCGGVVEAGLDVDEPAGGGQGDLSRHVRDVCVCGQAGRAGGVGAVGGADASPAVDRGVVQGCAGCGGAPVEECGRRARQGHCHDRVGCVAAAVGRPAEFAAAVGSPAVDRSGQAPGAA